MATPTDLEFDAVVILRKVYTSFILLGAANPAANSDAVFFAVVGVSDGGGNTHQGQHALTAATATLSATAAATPAATPAAAAASEPASSRADFKADFKRSCKLGDLVRVHGRWETADASTQCGRWLRVTRAVEMVSMRYWDSLQVVAAKVKAAKAEGMRRGGDDRFWQTMIDREKLKQEVNTKKKIASKKARKDASAAAAAAAAAAGEGKGECECEGGGKGEGEGEGEHGRHGGHNGHGHGRDGDGKHTSAGHRGSVMADFIINLVGGSAALTDGAGVVDVAGGSGHLSLALALKGVQSTVIDPRSRAGNLSKRDRRRLRKTPGAVPFHVLRAWFGGRPQGADTAFEGGADSESVPAVGEIAYPGPGPDTTTAVQSAAYREALPLLPATQISILAKPEGVSVKAALAKQPKRSRPLCKRTKEGDGGGDAGDGGGSCGAKDGDSGNGGGSGSGEDDTSMNGGVDDCVSGGKGGARNIHNGVNGVIDRDNGLPGSALMASCSAVVALHPDEATDAVVDWAVKYRKPFAVVPCCVFARLFPKRQLWGNAGECLGPVTNREELIEYLIAKDPCSIRKTTLAFDGANTCVWATFADDDDDDGQISGGGETKGVAGEEIGEGMSVLGEAVDSGEGRAFDSSVVEATTSNPSGVRLTA